MSGLESELRVADLMTRSVYTLRETQSVTLAEAAMENRHVRHIPVVDEAMHLVGLVTHRDLLSAKISSLVPLSADERTTLELSVPVSRIMRKQLWTIEPRALAVSAARIMREHRFGCLPVVDAGKLVGILTEADLLALVTDSLSLERPARPWTMNQVMTRVPVTITSDTTIAEARATMSRYGIRHLPVVDSERPIAIVTDRDLAVAETIFEHDERPRAVHVVRLLGTAQVHRVAPDDSVDHVLREMLEKHFDAVLVVDGGRLVGIFTAVDACRALAGAVARP
ncbi:MAG: CBS domain-containing protein [Deltaproteobacteria bacterium]|nr:CBS domain-containing protein [Deltaproteobacteria bacterium]